MIIVLDTNVLVSGLMVPDHAPGRIVDLLRAGDVRLAVDDRIMAEYEEVLARPRFRSYFRLEESERIMGFIRADSLPVVCTKAIGGLPDPKDAPFAEAALAAGAPLITGNTRHFPAEALGGVRVLTAVEFLDEFRRQSGSA
jgi:putative PIN family toxin of toxin-antitoxin system